MNFPSPSPPSLRRFRGKERDGERRRSTDARQRHKFFLLFLSFSFLLPLVISRTSKIDDQRGNLCGEPCTRRKEGRKSAREGRWSNQPSSNPFRSLLTPRLMSLYRIVEQRKRERKGTNPFLFPLGEKVYRKLGDYFWNTDISFISALLSREAEEKGNEISYFLKRSHPSSYPLLYIYIYIYTSNSNNRSFTLARGTNYNSLTTHASRRDRFDSLISQSSILTRYKRNTKADRYFEQNGWEGKERKRERNTMKGDAKKKNRKQSVEMPLPALHSYTHFPPVSKTLVSRNSF